MESARSPAERGHSDFQLGERLRFALPLVVVAVALIALGGAAFAAVVAVIAALAVVELLRLVRAPQAAAPVAALCAVAVVVTAYVDGPAGLSAALILALVPLFAVAGAFIAGPQRTAAVAFGLLGVAWIAGSLAHGVMLRELTHGGALVTAVLLATFIGDSAAHLIGAKFGRRLLAPSISPRKTVVGLVAGIVAGTASVLIFAAGWHEWMRLHEALVFGVVASLAAPAGDLCESMLKRSVGAKDSGRLLGPHGGVLDRIDAVLFTSVAGYYAALALF